MPVFANPAGLNPGAAQTAPATPTAGYNFGTALPFSAGAGNMDFSGNPAALGANYQSAYNAALGFNQANYNNITGGFQNVLGNLVPAQAGIAQGYTALGANVQDLIAGIGTSQAQQIQDQYAAQQGQATQDLTNRGLGNTTIVSSVQRGIGLDKAKAQTDLANTIAGTKAGYMNQIGQAGLQYQAQAAAMQAQVQQNELAMMERVSAAYPNAGIYAQLAQMWGQNQAADKMNKQLGGFNMSYGGGGGGGNMSYVPSGGGLPGPTPGTFGGGSSLSYAPTGAGYNTALAPQGGPGGFSVATSGYGKTDTGDLAAGYGNTPRSAFGGIGGAQQEADYGGYTAAAQADYGGQGGYDWPVEDFGSFGE